MNEWENELFKFGQAFAAEIARNEDKEIITLSTKKEEYKMITKVNNCQLEIDEKRGVLYVHSPQGKTLVRICRIPLKMIASEMIDVVYDRKLAEGGV